MPRKKKSKIYFGQEVQEAIIRYNDSDDFTKRNNIYKNEIHAAFDKLAENIINTFKFSYFDYGFEDIKNEVVAFLVMNMHKYDHTKGSKAFSYFSVVAKNYLILHNNNNYKKYKSKVDISSVDKEFNHFEIQERNKIKDFLNDMCEYFEENIPHFFKKQKDMKIAYAILSLLNKREEIENFNKKYIYILIKEMTDVNTADITKVTNVFRKKYKKLLSEYDKHGTLKVDLQHKKFF
jgi:hypothetical protein